MIEIEADLGAGTLGSEGHSDYAEKGKDIDCAGVSAVARVLALSTDGGMVLDDGKRMAIGGKHLPYQCVLQGCVKALEEIAEKYPGHVKMTVLG